ncbi:MAG: AraC family transcriptional regulator [Kiritimatiellae bacterium]|nr:AraC family transcriptional regulator [Kiritimatiellia bacterium]
MGVFYDPNIRLLSVRWIRLSAWRHDDLRASFWRLYWDADPGAFIRYGRRRVDLDPGHMVLVPPGMVIVQRLMAPMVRHFSVHFLVDAPFDRLAFRLYAFPVEKLVLRPILAFPLDRLDALRDDVTMSLAIRGTILCLLACIPMHDIVQRKLPVRLMESMRHVEANLRSGISNREIAEHMGVSVNVMMREYREELSLSPQEFLRQKRIERACLLLHDPARSIKQIADETGFCDRYHFSRVFKAIQGLSPWQYRQKHGL